MLRAAPRQPLGDASLGGSGGVARITLSDNDPRASTPSVKTTGAQVVLRQKGVIMEASSAADGTLTASGTIALPRRGAANVRLKPATANVLARQRVTLKLGLSKKARRVVKRAFARKRALRRKPVLTAIVKVTATDLAGGQASKTVRIELQRH